MKFRKMIKAPGGIVLAVALGCLVLAAPALADTDAELKKMPGYVEFNALTTFKGQEAKLEVYLKDPMLELVSRFVKGDDPELYAILAELKLVRVLVFDVTAEQAREVANVSSDTAKELDRKGWERIVRVREDNERIDVYLKPSKNYELIEGIVIMVVDDEDEAIFVNIVGNIHPDDIGKLGEHFDIDGLGDIDYGKGKGD